MGNLFCIRKLLVTKRKLDIKGHYRPFLSKFFLPHSVKEHRRVAPQCFRNFRVSKKFMHRKQTSRISVDYFLSHNAENLHTVTLQCFRKFWGIEKIHAEKGDTANGGLKNVKNGTFRVSMKFMHKKWLSCFSVENILSHSVVGNRGDFFVYQKNSGHENNYT